MQGFGGKKDKKAGILPQSIPALLDEGRNDRVRTDLTSGMVRRGARYQTGTLFCLSPLVSTSNLGADEASPEAHNTCAVQMFSVVCIDGC